MFLFAISITAFRMAVSSFGRLSLEITTNLSYTWTWAERETDMGGEGDKEREREEGRK